MKSNAHTPPQQRDGPTWLGALMAFVRSLLTSAFDDIILPLAYGPRPTRGRLYEMAKQFAREEGLLTRQIQDAARALAGLPSNPDTLIIYAKPPRTGPEFAARLAIHLAKLHNPQVYVDRIVRRMSRAPRSAYEALRVSLTTAPAALAPALQSRAQVSAPDHPLFPRHPTGPPPLDIGPVSY